MNTTREIKSSKQTKTSILSARTAEISSTPHRHQDTNVKMTKTYTMKKKKTHLKFVLEIL
jgi:1,2-phenylacetyl-CoA epoxidase PaaB subunit